MSSSVAAEEELVLAIEKKGALQLMIVLNTTEKLSGALRLKIVSFFFKQTFSCVVSIQ